MSRNEFRRTKSRRTTHLAIWINRSREGVCKPVKGYRCKDLIQRRRLIRPFHELLTDPATIRNSPNRSSHSHLPSKQRQRITTQDESNRRRTTCLLLRVGALRGHESRPSIDTSTLGIGEAFYRDAFWPRHDAEVYLEGSQYLVCCEFVRQRRDVTYNALLCTLRA